MSVKNNLAKCKRNELHESAISGDFNAANKCIHNDINIYKRTAQHETPLHLAMMNGHSEIATTLWNIYEHDLKFIEQALYFQHDGDQFWLKKPILISFGAENISSFEELYVEYEKCELDRDVDKSKCVVFLLKRDNLSPEKVVCLSPKSEPGRMLTVRMIQCVLSNDTLDLHARTYHGLTIINSTARAGASNIFEKLVNFGIDPDLIDIVLKAMQYGHVEFLDLFYKKYPTNMYDFFRSYCLRILGSNKWAVFKYYAEKIIAEQQITWTQIINYRLPFRNTTVFHYSISHDLIEIAEHLIDYKPDLSAKDTTGHGPLYYLKWNYTNPEPYQRLIMKMIEIDPSQLSIVDAANYTVCHKLVSGLRVPELVQFDIKYPDAKKIFFNNEEIALKLIGGMITSGHLDTKTLMGTAIVQINQKMLYSILNHLVRVNNVELFIYVMSLVEHDFTTPTIEKEYPLVTALENHNLEIFNLIWSKVKNSDLNNLFYDLLRCTIQKPELNQLFDEILEKCSDLNSLYSSMGKSLLHWSAIADNLHTAKELIKREVKVEFEYIEEDVLLPSHYAESVEMYELLNSYTDEADKETQSYQTGFTPLHNCMTRQSNDKTLKLIEYLITIGGDIDQTDYEGRTSIFYAGDIKIATCLLKFNPNLNQTDEQGNSPIHYAFKTNRPNVAYILMEHDSVDYSIRNNDGWSYLRCLVTEQYDYGDLELVLSDVTSKFRAYLVDHCNDLVGYGTPIILEALKSNPILSSMLLNQPDQNLLAYDPYNRNTPLHVAVRFGRADIVDLLIDRNLQINEQNVDGDTPLNLYCRHSVDICDEVLRRCLKHNPDVHIKNDRGMSPILYVASKDKTGAAVCELLAHGSSLMNINPNGQTAYDKLEIGLQEIFKFLLDK